MSAAQKKLLELVPPDRLISELEQENRQVEHIMTEVAARANMPRVPVKVNLAWGPSFPQLGMNNGNGGVLLYSPVVTSHLTPYQLKGVIAHELGHNYYQDHGASSHALEYRADEFATLAGYGPNLIDSLEWLQAHEPRSAKSSDSHPSVPDRIKKIREVMGGQQWQQAA